jgi:hypothetical protein
MVAHANATDWSIPEQQLARKIASMCGTTAVSLTIENRSSIGRRDSEIVQNGLRMAIGAAGVHVARDASDRVAITLSENLTSYVWVATLQKAVGESPVVMVSVPRPAGSFVAPESVPLALRKTLVWSQERPILDVAVLEESGSPTRIAVLSPESVSLYRTQGGKWQQEVMMEIVHDRPWPRDLRGRLVPAKDHLLDAYLPGVTCRSTLSTPTSLTCREGEDPWPLAASSAIPSLNGFFLSGRNFFTGTITGPIGKVMAVSRFYSAAPLMRENVTLWLFAGIDGQIHVVDGVSERGLTMAWGSDIAGVRTSCGAGWQILASGAEVSTDSLRAYEFPDRDPVAVSPEIDFGGPLSALWTEARGDTAIAVARNKETGVYEAFRLAVACSQ